MRKFEVYVETSVWGAAANTEPAYYREAAVTLLKRVTDFGFCVSEVVLKEVAAAASPVKAVVEKLIAGVYPRLLALTDEVNGLAAEYVGRGVFPTNYRADALHVAVASFYATDYLVSYSFRHIVRVSRRELIKAANTFLGYTTPQIISAEELAEETWE